MILLHLLIISFLGLMKAAEEGDNITVRRLLSKGHEVDETDDVNFYKYPDFIVIYI